MCNRISGFKSHLGIASLAGTFLVVSYAHAGALNGMDDPDRIPGQYLVGLKRDHIVSLNNTALTDAHEIKIKSEKWQAAEVAAAAEVAQIVSRLLKAHPNVKISAVLSEGKAPGFVLRASDEDARAIANDDDVAEVDAAVLLRNMISSDKPERSHNKQDAESGDPLS
jgi:hypothetical protein